MNQKINDLIEDKIIEIIQLRKNQKYEECIAVANGYLMMFFNEATTIHSKNKKLNTNDKGVLAALKDVCVESISLSEMNLKKIKNEEECKIIS